MNFFRFHIGDYAKATAHLTLEEDATYLRLLFYYYETELPISTDTKQVSRRIRSDLEVVNAILGEFFYLTPEGWRHRRCDAELEKIYGKSAQAKAAIDLRWERKHQADQLRANADLSALESHYSKDTDVIRTYNGRNTKSILPSNPVTHDPITQDPKESTPLVQTFGSDGRKKVRSSKSKSRLKDIDPAYLADASCVLKFLNDQTGRALRTNRVNLGWIADRMSEGATFEMCCEVIINRCDAWKGDQRTADWLRPSTLFGPKFWEYSGMVPVVQERKRELVL